MSRSADSDMTINALPTKELFIEMLTRDITLIPAIIDLADNCVDGAKRLRGVSRLDGLWVRIKLSQDEFRIVDNCGGMSPETARKYAFRFGRAAGAPTVKHSVGQFGVGMKRAVFKMGRKFGVHSATESTNFAVDIDVQHWAALPLWTFEFTSLQENITVAQNHIGTTVYVSQLHPDVAQSFALRNFESELKEALQAKLQDPIMKGLTITLNEIPLNADAQILLSSKDLIPAYRALKYTAPNMKPVIVKLFCGLGNSENRAAAGWHVFCNGRLVLEGDKSEMTGWGESAAGATIPGFHGQFNHLRGYAYFDSDDAGRLPWNTTKTGINTDSSVYRAVKMEMITLMRPVVDFLNRLKDEKEGKNDGPPGPLEKLIESSPVASIESVQTREAFILPKLRLNSAKKAPTTQRIQYDRPLAQVNAVKKTLGARSFVEVGERTFDYFYNAEVAE